MKVADAIRSAAACPRCHALIDKHCHTATGRNHPERVHAALVEAIKAIPRLRSSED